jgi:hypothetical protein
MSLLELDRYYTPESVARELVEVGCAPEAVRCFDSACGGGELLRAAVRANPKVQCYGMDIDARAIRSLRRRHGDWVLSCADALHGGVWCRARAARDSVGSDLALLNPPFSMASTKGVVIEAGGFAGRCSVAMAHVMTVLVRATPLRVAAVVPESFMYSELDDTAREFIRCRYDIDIVRGLRNTTFQGTRANSLVVALERRDCAKPAIAPGELLPRPSSLSVVRGGLPVFEARRSPAAVPLLHSTSLGLFGTAKADLPRVKAIGRGVVSGCMICIPRVGIPSPLHLRVVRVRSALQLSDCVVALVFASARAGHEWRRVLIRNWTAFTDLYRGTGARYVTVRRLERWLASMESATRSERLDHSRGRKGDAP